MSAGFSSAHGIAIWQRVVVGYHATFVESVDGILGESEAWTPSKHKWDWLGPGVYFFEESVDVAWRYGVRRARQRGRSPEEVRVIGAHLWLGRCFDLTDPRATKLLCAAHERMSRELAANHAPLPKNQTSDKDDGTLLYRYLDCAVINYAVGQINGELGEDGPPRDVQTVRGAFEKGPPAFEGSQLRTYTHLQLAVRDPGCILNRFVIEANPLTSTEHEPY